MLKLKDMMLIGGASTAVVVDALGIVSDAHSLLSWLVYSGSVIVGPIAVNQMASHMLNNRRLQTEGGVGQEKPTINTTSRLLRALGFGKKVLSTKINHEEVVMAHYKYLLTQPKTSIADRFAKEFSNGYIMPRNSY